MRLFHHWRSLCDCGECIHYEQTSFPLFWSGIWSLQSGKLKGFSKTSPTKIWSSSVSTGQRCWERETLREHWPVNIFRTDFITMQKYWLCFCTHVLYSARFLLAANICLARVLSRYLDRISVQANSKCMLQRNTFKSTPDADVWAWSCVHPWL